MDSKQKTSRKTTIGKKRKGKLKTAAVSGKDDSNVSTGEQINIDVLKALTGESSLDQSEDFREVTKHVRLTLKKVNTKPTKKSEAAKSKSKSSKPKYDSSTKKATSSSKSQEETNKIRIPVLDNKRNHDSSGKKASTSSESKDDKNKDGKSDINNQHTQHTDEVVRDVANDEAKNIDNDSSLTSCSVVLSMLPLSGETVDKDSTIQTDLAESVTTRSDDYHVDTRTCPVCQTQMHTGSQEMQDHVNSCLKKRFSAVADTSEDECLAHQLQEREKEKATEETLTADEFYPCQFCHKDLSRMNSTRRIQHVNRCIDTYEEERQRQERIHAKTAKRTIQDCPMCGLQLNTKLQRDAHLKRCAKELNVSSAQLIELVKKQTEEMSAMQAIASPHTASHSKQQAPKPKGKTKKKQKKPIENVNLDEEMQVAMALSASVAPQHISNPTTEEIGKKKVKRKKKNAADKEIPVLLVRSEGERQRMLESRMSNLIAPQGVGHLSKTPVLHQSRVADKHGASKTSAKSNLERQTSVLWELSAENNPELVSSTPFYVSKLGPNIRPEIPVPVSRMNTHGQGDTERSVRCPDGKDDDLSTQTVSSTLQVLMELQDEGAHASSSPIMSGVSSLQSSGFLGNKQHMSSQSVKPICDHERLLLQQLSGLVNQDELSDVKIQTSDGNMVYAHKLVLHLRCPELLQNLNDNCRKNICTLDIPKNELLSILQYVYCGSTDIDDTIAMNVLQFAQKFHMPDLARACQPILKSKVTPHKASKTDGEAGDAVNPSIISSSDEDEYQVKDLNELLQTLWDDEEESNSSDQDTDKATTDECPDDEEMQEIYEYASTQTKQQTKQVRNDDDRTELEALLETLADNDSDIESDSHNIENTNESADNCIAGSSGGDKDITEAVVTPSHQTNSDSHNQPQNPCDDESIQQCIPSSQLSQQESQIPASTGRLTRRGWKLYEYASTQTTQQTKQVRNDDDRTELEALLETLSDNDSDIESDSQSQIPASTGRLTRRGWKPFKEASPRKRQISDDDSSGKQFSKTADASCRTADDLNDQDVEMEDVNQDADKAIETNFKESDEATEETLTTNGSRHSQSKNLKISTQLKSTEDTGRIIVSSPKTRSKKKDDDIVRVNTPPEDTQRSVVDESAKKEDGNDPLADQLNDSIDDSDASWIIPDTPPAPRSSSLPRKTFLPPKTRSPQSKVSSSPSCRSRQSAIRMMASTPMDARIKTSSLLGGDFLPKMSPVKIVLEKLPLHNSFDTSIHGQSIVNEKSSIGDTEQSQASLSKITDHSKRMNGQQGGKGQRLSNRKRRASQQESDKFNSDQRTRSKPNQSPIHPVKRRNGSSNYPKAHLKQKNIQSSNQKTVSPVRQSRRVSANDSLTPVSSHVIPDIISVSTPVVISDDSRSPSPTPSPTFGVSSISTFHVTKKSKGENLNEFLDRPSKRKRKQSMPMRSPDKLLLTTSDTAVLVDDNQDVSMVHKKTPSHYASPRIRRKTPSYFSVKKKYKSFAPVGHQARKRRRTRSMSKDTVLGRSNSLQGNASSIAKTGKQSNTTSVLRTAKKSDECIAGETSRKHQTNSSSQENTAAQMASENHQTTKSSMSLAAPIESSDEKASPEDRAENPSNQTVNEGIPDTDDIQIVDCDITRTDGPAPSAVNTDKDQGVENNPVLDSKDTAIVDCDDGDSKENGAVDENTAVLDCDRCDNTNTAVLDCDNKDTAVVDSENPQVLDCDEQETNNTDYQEDEALFAFEVENGAFDGFESIHSHVNNNNLDQTHQSEKSVSSPDKYPKENGVPTSPAITKQPSGGIRSPPEVRIAKPSQRDKFEGLLANVYITPSSNGISEKVSLMTPDSSVTRQRQVHTIKPSRDVTSPVITEKVKTVESYTVRQSCPVENYEDSIQTSSLVPSHRQSTASPTLRDHHFSPTQLSPTSEGAVDDGYFGCASESFTMQEEVVGFGDDAVMVDEAPFVPPGCATPVNHMNSADVCIVRPLPLRVTPTLKKATSVRRSDQYLPPGPITPMPNYEAMDTPALKKETFKYGLKPLRKKQARLKLKEIYQYTHQVLETSLDEEPNNEQTTTIAKKKTSRSPKKLKPPKTAKNKPAKGQGSHVAALTAGEEGKGDRKINAPKKTVNKGHKPSTGGHGSSAEGHGSKGKGHGSSTESHGSPTKSHGSYSSLQKPTKRKAGAGSESSTGDTSDAPSYGDCPEDSIMEEDDIPMSQPISKNPEEAIANYIRGNKELHHKILMYEPFFIKEFHKNLKEAGINYPILELKAYLDKQCITFRADAGGSRQKRTPKKKKKK